MNRTRKWISLGILGVLLPLGACNILDVESPGKITDDSLNNPDAFPSLVYGMSYSLANANDNVEEIQTLLSGEMWHGGSYDWGKIPRGIILPEDVDNSWAWMQQAQWVTDHGIERMQSVYTPEDFGSSPLVAQAYLYGGFADRLIGELVCEAVIDSAAPQPNTVEFDRAKDKFTKAIEIGTAAGLDDDDPLILAAYGGRASVTAWLGDWAAATADAEKVPVDFQYDAILNASANNQNTIAYETHARFEYTLWGTVFADHYGDPRVPWDTLFTGPTHDTTEIQTGANGSSEMFQQNKYDNVDDDIPLTHGTEMLVLRAEAALRLDGAAGIGPAFDLLNEARASYGMSALATPATLEEAWNTLHYERAATVFLENRHLWDVRRWYAEEGPAHYDFLAPHPELGQDYERDSCIPISREERNSNPNVP
jgi:hypothetical protein